MIVTPHNATPRCTATVDLISRVMRPYLFQVTVVGEYPHAFRRVYPIAADTEESAAVKGMELFVKEYGRPIPGQGTIAPKAKLA